LTKPPPWKGHSEGDNLIHNVYSNDTILENMVRTKLAAARICHCPTMLIGFLMKWSMDHVLTWGYMSNKDIGISSEWQNRHRAHFMTLTYFTPEK
jgi:hypothetical protein